MDLPCPSLLLSLTLSLTLAVTAPGQELTVLPNPFEGGPPRQMMSRYLKQLAHAALEKRRQTVEGLKSPRDIEAYQHKQRQVFLEQIGGLPARTPLNARVVAKLEGDGCRLEKIIFESRPRHFVTATLYLPKTPPPYPAVLHPCGHTDTGKAANQVLCAFLARNGLAAFTYDPIGQGERYQLLTDEGKPRHQSTTEHTLVGVSSILVGQNTATYRIWDGMRALDYLESREDIDRTRFGCTGISGGGTLTEYLMALDPRIQCAAPGCAPMSFARRIETIGPGDAEQNIFGQIALGLDHAEYFHLRAPRPTLLLAATHDFVDIQGTWDLFREASRVYAKLGHAERIALVEADAKHGFSQPLRVGTVRWMRRWLLKVDDAVTEPEIATRPVRELWCTPQGQVQLLEGARSVMDFNQELARQGEPARKKLWQAKDREPALAEVRKLAGISRLTALPRPNVRPMGKVERPGYTIEKLVMEPSPGLWLPALFYRPAEAKRERVLYLHGAGKHADADSLQQLVKDGHPVLALDLRGSGETGSAAANLWGGSFADIFLAYLLGKSFVGMRAEDVLLGARYLSELETVKPTRIRLIAVEGAGPPALHAVALERQLFSHLTLRRCSTSWLPIVRDPTPAGQLVHTVHGALRSYDLTDLLSSLPADMVTREEGKK